MAVEDFATRSESEVDSESDVETIANNAVESSSDAAESSSNEESVTDDGSTSDIERTNGSNSTDSALDVVTAGCKHVPHMNKFFFFVSLFIIMVLCVPAPLVETIEVGEFYAVQFVTSLDHKIKIYIGQVTQIADDVIECSFLADGAHIVLLLFYRTNRT
jgi:hypothetical protein